MTLTASGTRRVQATSREVLEFVLDLERYRQADTKIRRVTQPIVLDDNNEGRARYWGRVRCTPPTPDTNNVKLDPWKELTFTGAPGQPARLFLNFTGRFECAETDDGCQVIHSYEMKFRRPLRWVYEPLLRTWLQTDLDAELDRLATIIGEQP